MKQLEGDIWEDFFTRQKAGDVVKVKIVRLTDFGAFVEIIPGIEGVVFTSELDEKKLEKPSDAFAVGDERNAKIIKMNPKAKKISLSFKQARLRHGEAGLPALHGIAERPDDPRRHHERPAEGLQGPQEEEPKRRTPMIKADLINKISQEMNIPKQEAEEGVNLFFETIREAILRGEEIEIRGFGSFRFRKRTSRAGRNPRTGEPVKVPPKKVLYFKPSKLLKELINK